jgi:hypothetical protein
MIASEIVSQRKAVQRRPPPAAGSDYTHAATGGQVYERRDGATRSNRASRWDFLSRSTLREEFEQLYSVLRASVDPTEAG